MNVRSFYRGNGEDTLEIYRQPLPHPFPLLNLIALSIQPYAEKEYWPHSCKENVSFYLRIILFPNTSTFSNLSK